MEKEINLIKSEKDYKLTGDNINIVIKDKKIDAGKIYEDIYSKISFDGNKIKINLTTTLDSPEDKIIFTQIKKLFELIDNAVNEQLK